VGSTGPSCDGGKFVESTPDAISVCSQRVNSTASGQDWRGARARQASMAARAAEVRCRCGIRQSCAAPERRPLRSSARARGASAASATVVNLQSSTVNIIDCYPYSKGLPCNPVQDSRGCAFSRRSVAFYFAQAIFARLIDLAILSSVLRKSLLGPRHRNSDAAVAPPFPSPPRRLLQHNRHKADMPTCLRFVRFEGDCVAKLFWRPN
jgi:hypothetical protein